MNEEPVIGRWENEDMKSAFIKNGSGYHDPTAYEAIKNIEKDYERFRKVLDAVFAVCDAADFHIEERIVIKDKRTGKIWR